MGAPRSAVAALLMLVAGCEQGVELGTQCRRDAECTGDNSRALPAGDANASDASGLPVGAGGNDPVPPEAVLESDGGSPLAPLDGAAALDAGLDGSVDFFANGSLEVSAYGSFGDFAVLDLSFQQNRGVISPWIPCQIVNFNTATSDAGLLTFDTAAHTLQPSIEVDGTTVVPAEGSTFMTMSFPPLIPPAVVVIPISQVLPEPMRRGQTYAFTAQVRRVDPLHDYSLRIFLSGASPTCAPGGPAVADAVVPNSDRWERICLEFTPDADYPELLLSAGSTSVEITPDKTVGFLLDALHQVPSCVL